MPKANEKDSNSKNEEEYGVVLKKKEKYRRRIFPQKGKKPSKDDDSYKIV